jgi:hypothetical protein
VARLASASLGPTRSACGDEPGPRRASVLRRRIRAMNRFQQFSMRWLHAPYLAAPKSDVADQDGGRSLRLLPSPPCIRVRTRQFDGLRSHHASGLGNAEILEALHRQHLLKRGVAQTPSSVSECQRGMETIRDKMGHCLHGSFTITPLPGSPSVHSAKCRPLSLPFVARVLGLGLYGSPYWTTPRSADRRP